MRKTLAVALVLLVSCLASSASPRGSRVVVLKPDDELVRAIALALAPWGLETVRSETSPPGPSQPDAVRGATRLARELDAQALVWVTKIDGGSLLWVFDVGTGDVTTRLSTETPPFDSAAAAAVALSVKTVLRDSAVAPTSERFEEHVPSSQRTFALEASGGVHLVAEETFDPRGELALVWWFAPEAQLGLALELSGGLGSPVRNVDFDARYREFVAGASARFAPVELPRFRTVLSLGGSAHWAVLEGNVAGRVTESSRVNGAVHLGVAGDFFVSKRAYLGLEAGARYFPRYQRYLVDGAPVFSPFPITAIAMAHVGFELF